MTEHEHTRLEQIDCDVCGRQFGEAETYLSVKVNAVKLDARGSEVIEHSENVATLCTDCAATQKVSSDVSSNSVGDAMGRILTVVAPSDPE